MKNERKVMEAYESYYSWMISIGLRPLDYRKWRMCEIGRAALEKIETSTKGKK